MNIVARRTAKTLANFVRLIEQIGGGVPADAPLIRYRPADFSAALAAGYMDLDKAGAGRYALTNKGHALAAGDWRVARSTAPKGAWRGLAAH